MDCLWITLADPDPATNGQLIYSEGLIRAARGAGASLCVVGLAAARSPIGRSMPGLAWRLVRRVVAALAARAAVAARGRRSAASRRR